MRLLPLLCLLLAAGCGQPAAPGSDAPPVREPAAPLPTGPLDLPDDALVEDTSRAVFADLQQRWEEARPARYTFTYEAICFCLERGPFTVTVENGALTGIEPPAPDYRHLTLDSLYARVADAYAQGAALVRFQYEPQHRMLAGFYIDYDEQMADEEFGARITQLTPGAQ